MIAVDTNILVYAHRSDSPFHARAKERVAELAASETHWAIPWPCVYEFFNVVTHPRIYSPPTPVEIVLDRIDTWSASPGLVVLSEEANHWPALRMIIKESRVIGPRIHDARIAAICIQHQVSELWSADRDFSSFPGLKVVNPLVG